ncbi:MAG: ATP-binding cassette domain-containing protein, partial [Desulfosarcinaceae bacterium]|nr:ATP-binding cassette domain-containing protein [Desulfosarcinaceae bacterium]
MGSVFPEMIELQEIGKTYRQGGRQVTALHPVRLSLPKGGLTVVRGPSGSGKTTLLSIIGLMCRPTTGRMFIEGSETTSLPEHFAARLRRKSFGFVFQNYNLIRGLSVLHNTMIPAFPEAPPYGQLRERALSLLDRLAVAEKAHQPVAALSGGELQRVAIARALINQPQILIADEPTAHLDTPLAERFLA